MRKYLVVSYDNDEERYFFDQVLADNSEAALEIIGGIRGDYAFMVCALTPVELATMSKRLSGATERMIKDRLAALRAAEA